MSAKRSDDIIEAMVIGGGRLFASALRDFLEDGPFRVVVDAPSVGVAIDRARTAGAAPTVAVIRLDGAPEASAAAVKRLTAAFPMLRTLLLDDEFDLRRMTAAFRAGFDGYQVEGVTPRGLRATVGLLAAGERVLPSDLADLVLRGAAAQLAANAGAAPAAPLTPRERDIVMRVGEGLPNKSIAAELGLQETTVAVHLRAVRRKLGAANRTQVALWAARAAQ